VLKREFVNELSLLYTWPGSDPAAKPIMLMAHQDVVPIAPGTERDWQVEPFSGEIRDGFVWGRGAWDDKANLFAIFEAIETLAASGFKPRQTIYIASGHDEEIGGEQGAKAIAALLQSRGVKLDFVVDEGLLITEGILKGLDRPAALIGIAEKGYLTLALAAKARPGHSSMPPPKPPSACSALPWRGWKTGRCRRHSRRRRGNVRHHRAGDGRIEPRAALQPLAVRPHRQKPA
jgi:carboxypeptidase PM20D1